MCPALLDAPRRELFIRIFKSAVALLISRQINFVCVCTGRPIQLYTRAVLSREALRPGLGRSLLANVMATKAAGLVHHGIVEPIKGRGRLHWCPRRLRHRMSRDHLTGKLLHLPIKWPEAGSALKFSLQPLTLSYLRTKIQLTKVWHVIHQNAENFLSFLE